MSSDNSSFKSNIARGSILHILVMKMSFESSWNNVHGTVICFSTAGSYMSSSKLNNTQQVSYVNGINDQLWVTDWIPIKAFSLVIQLQQVCMDWLKEMETEEAQSWFVAEAEWCQAGVPNSPLSLPGPATQAPRRKHTHTRTDTRTRTHIDTQQDKTKVRNRGSKGTSCPNLTSIWQ